MRGPSYITEIYTFPICAYTNLIANITSLCIFVFIFFFVRVGRLGGQKRLDRGGKVKKQMTAAAYSAITTTTTTLLCSMGQETAEATADLPRVLGTLNSHGTPDHYPKKPLLYPLESSSGSQYNRAQPVLISW